MRALASRPGDARPRFAPRTPAWRCGARAALAAHFVFALLAALLASLPAQAQDTTTLVLHPDFGGPVTGVGGLFTLGEDEGIRPQSGPNRFHVFDRFDVAADDTVEWASALPTDNIFNLVTGGDASLISGRLRSSLDADVYFVNPDGIIFGQGAELDLQGSFFASTADQLEFAGGGQLTLRDADRANVMALAVADFEVFGFLDANESIDIDGAQLVVQDDAVLGLFAGRHVRVDPAVDTSLAVLQAGRVEIETQTGDVRLLGGRVTSSGTAMPGGPGVRITASDEIDVERGSVVESTGDLAITLTARTIEVDDTGSEVVSRVADVDAGAISLVADQRIMIGDGARVASEASGTGTAGDIDFTARDLLLLGSEVTTSASAPSAGQGDIDFSVERVANVVDGRIESDVPGANAGRVSITAPLVVLQGDTRVASRASSVAVEADLLVRTAEAEIEAPTVDISGNEIVRTLQADLNERLEVLPQHFFEQQVRLERSCAARSGEALGSLVLDRQRVTEYRPNRLRRAHYQTRRERLHPTASDEPASWNPFPDWLHAISRPTADDWLYLAQRGERIGNLSSASTAASQGISIVEHDGQRAALHAVRARIRASIGDPDGAQRDFAAANEYAFRSDDAALRAGVQLDGATTMALAKEFDAAIPALEFALSLARTSEADAVAMAAEANLASTLLAAGRREEAVLQLEEHLNPAPQLPITADEIDSAIHLALAAYRAGLRQPAADLLIAIAAHSTRLDQDREVAFAWAYLAQFYADEGRDLDAIELTRWAIEASLASDELARIAPLEVQLGDLLRRAGDLSGAVRAYDMALRATPLLGPSGALPLVRDPFADTSASLPVATRLVDALLGQATQTTVLEARSDLLRQARDRVEAQRVRELRNHFRDPCIVAIERQPADSVPRSLVVHPVPLDDRLALIVSSGGGLRAYDVPVGRVELLARAAATERQLRDRTTNRFQAGAAQLYEWLIRPIEAEITAPDVDTLVFVAGPGLRSFPMATLFDARDERYLIEKIAVAATQGLTLTQPRSLDPKAFVMLRAGLDGAPKGGVGLPTVSRELEALATLFDGVELIGERFQAENIERALTRDSFDVIHIASHGRFPANGDAPYLVTAGDPLGLDDLAAMIRRTRFRDRPTELITLSACETAVGDEGAALGFAGLALRSGARSTLATLWRVNDQASADFMQTFYARLAEGDTTRAGALREAQLDFLDNTVLRHPYFWAPYLLLGNWQ
ncbi:MAG: CHAT domain-containing protein [Myxococcota bacterium]|jgi:filamentous hemagglutinin family protein|nr:CHAT domain-containing protein [Myxococcota bacterium]